MPPASAPGGDPRAFLSPAAASPTAQLAPARAGAADAAAAAAAVPTEAELGAPIYPGAQYLDSFDAGRGQRFHLFGTNQSFQNMVVYYTRVLDDGGRRIFDAPPVHHFETARFRDEEMTYRPGVTIKDYVWNGGAGYLHPAPGAEPASFPTVIQFTTLPAGAAAR